LRFLGIILRVIRLEVFLYDVYITNQFQTNFAHGVGGGGSKTISRGDCEKQGGKLFCPNYVQEFGLWSLVSEYRGFNFYSTDKTLNKESAETVCNKLS
jgi:hypothetical protein